MIQPSSNGGTVRPFFTPIRFQDLDVSWSGPNPFGPGFVFGSEDGRVLMTDDVGTPFDKPWSITGEAINGIAGSGRSFAASSRSEVALVTMTVNDPNKKAHVSGIPFGAHGITLAPSGHYVAPLGRTGIMILPPTSTEPSDPIGVITPHQEGLYFYEVVALPGREGKDLLVCAARQGGMGITEFQPGQPDTISMKVLTFAGLDLVDVCPVGGTPEAPAVAGVGRDGTLVLVRDALHDQKPVTFKFESVQGTAYRLLSARGHLFLLTSRGLYGLMNLGERLVQGRTTERFTTPILAVPMEAVDANMVGGRWLLVTMPDEVRKFDVDLIDQSTPEDSRNGQIREVVAERLTPDWQVHMQSVPQRSRQLAGGV